MPCNPRTAAINCKPHVVIRVFSPFKVKTESDTKPASHYVARVIARVAWKRLHTITTYVAVNNV